MENPTANMPGTSLSGFVTTLVPTALVAAIYIFIFLILRMSYHRYYAPRAHLASLRTEERSVPLPSGLFNWIGPFFKIPDMYALQHQSLDAYLFLRFLRMTIVIMFVGACITWPVLFPVNITGGGSGGQLDILSMSHINKDTEGGKYRYFAHCFCGWLFFGFILALVMRESIFYINLRQAFLLSPGYANRISARTVLFTSVPHEYRDEFRLRKVFGKSVQNVWITRDTKKVDELVEERDEVAYKLESAEVKLIRLANKERLKKIKKGEARIGHTDAESEALATRYIPTKKRPTHKLGKFGLCGERVDSIDWCRSRLEILIPATKLAQESYRRGETATNGSVFIEFVTQADAQAAFQLLSHHRALHMSPRYIGVNPNEVVWKSLKISWWQRIVRRIAVLSFIAALILFWAVPVAAVGFISNVSYLETFSWLSWLTKIPTIIRGVISGLLPSVALSILMSLVPVIIRLCAKIAGEPSLAHVELFTQNAYFVFQVVQVFLVMTIASSASSIVQSIIAKPTSITALLAQRLPTASNFYMSYFIVQGLTIASSVLSQALGFVIFTLMYKYLADTPRALYTRWANLSAISWGNTLPVFTNIAVIGITYSCIAPLILGFATIGMTFFYVAYRYNILFVSDSPIDTKGLIYPRALQQLLTGVYIAEICLIGIFAIAEAIGPLVCMIAFLIFTTLFHVSINSALDPLVYNLPKSLAAEDQALRGGIYMKEKGGDEAITSAPHSSMLTKFLRLDDYATLRRLVSRDLPHADQLYEKSVEEDAYYPLSVRSDPPSLWIPKDLVGVSRREVADTSHIIPITDEGCTIDDASKLILDTEEMPPFWNPQVYY